jgi:hypothetical protein
MHYKSDFLLFFAFEWGQHEIDSSYNKGVFFAKQVYLSSGTIPGRGYNEVRNVGIVPFYLRNRSTVVSLTRALENHPIPTFVPLSGIVPFASNNRINYCSIIYIDVAVVKFNLFPF